MAPRGRAATAPAPKPEIDPALLPAQDQDLEKQDFWQRHANLTEEEKKVSTIYVYRLIPPIANEGEDSNIDMIPSHLFDRELLISKHGGGKFQFYHNSKLEGTKYNFKRVVSIPGIPAKIYPSHILVDDKGNPLPVATATPAVPAIQELPTKDDIRSIIRETTAAAKTGNDATQEALKSGISLVTTGAGEAMKIIANAKGSGDSEGIASLRAEIAELKTAINNREKEQLQQQIADLRAKVENGPARGGGEMEALSETSKVLGVEGGILGLVKAVIGGGSAAKEDIWEYGGKKIADALGSFITDNGPALITWMRERTHVQRMEVLTRRQQAGMSDVPMSPAPPAAPVHARPAAPQPHTLQPTEPQAEGEAEDRGQMSGEEMLQMLRQQFPAMIRYYWDRDFSGESAAIVVKGNFKPWLPLLRMQFSDLNKVIELAKAEPQLASITADPEFLDWAKEFFEEFHKVEPDEAPPPAAA